MYKRFSMPNCSRIKLYLDPFAKRCRPWSRRPAINSSDHSSIELTICGKKRSEMSGHVDMFVVFQKFSWVNWHGKYMEKTMTNSIDSTGVPVKRHRLLLEFGHLGLWSSKVLHVLWRSSWTKHDKSVINHEKKLKGWFMLISETSERHDASFTCFTVPRGLGSPLPRKKAILRYNMVQLMCTSSSLEQALSRIKVLDEKVGTCWEQLKEAPPKPPKPLLRILTRSLLPQLAQAEEVNV